MEDTSLDTKPADGVVCQSQVSASMLRTEDSYHLKYRARATDMWLKHITLSKGHKGPEIEASYVFPLAGSPTVTIAIFPE